MPAGDNDLSMSVTYFLRANTIARAFGVNGGQRSIVTGVQRREAIAQVQNTPRRRLACDQSRASPCVAPFFSYTNGSPELIAGKATRLSSGSRGGPFRGARLAPFARWPSGTCVKIQTYFRIR